MGFKCNKYHLVLMLLSLVILYSSMLEAALTGLLPEGRECVCVGDRLTYNCSITDGTATATLWSGTALNCPTDGSEITIRHSQFASNDAIGICNNGDIVGRGLAVVNNCYTSQLNLTVRESFNNKTVQCAFTSNEGTRRVGESLLSVVSATNLYPPPDNLYLADVQPGKLIFSWTPVISICSILQYSITSDCGACPTVANTTTASCSDLPLATNAALCHFRVSNFACDLVGNLSSPAAVTLKVPNVPQVEIVPSYSNNSQALERLFIVMIVNQTEDHFYISGNISGSPISYTAHGSNQIDGTSFNSTVSMASCEEAGGCSVEVPSFSCPQSALNVSISAANKLGEGPRSSPFMIECTNNFVQVEHKVSSIESTISCVFLNQADTSEKSCCVTYRPCDQRERGSAQICNRESPYNIKLKVTDPSSKDYYYYTVTARNDSHTVKIEGTFILGDNHRGNSHTAALTAGVVVPIIFILLLVSLLGTGMLWVVKTKRPREFNNSIYTDPTMPYNYPQNPLKQYLSPYSLPTTSKEHELVGGDYGLREFITDTLSVGDFQRGHTYYEFTNEMENIHEGKEVLLQSKENSKKWFQLALPEQVAAGGLKLYGEGIARSNFGDRYRVFIQSFGSGARLLPDGSSILYNHSDNQVQPDVLPLVPVCSHHFAHKVINSEEECTVQQFCTQNGLGPRAFSIFLTMEHLPEGMRDQRPKDVILMNRESKKLFTGPFARQMLDPKSRCESQHENEKWRVFALLEKNKPGLHSPLKEGSEVLYQDPKYKTRSYRVLDVDQDYVRLSKFIESKLNCQYEDGKAFYEVTENDPEENLLYCKKILRPQTHMLNREELQLESLIEYFYAIPGVPTKAVEPEQLRLDQHKVFIQSTSQGSRCLKKGTKILYLKEYIRWADDHQDDPEVLFRHKCIVQQS